MTGMVVAGMQAPAEPTPMPSARALVARADIGRPSNSRPPVAAVPRPAATPASRFQLSGVVARDASNSRSGFALISIDGGPAHLFRVGAPVGDRVLRSVGASSASLASPGGGPTVVLELGKAGSIAAAVPPRPVARVAPVAPAASGVPDPMTPEGSSEAPPNSN